jgi:transcriptional regulator with XRE-family HTH domain
MHAAIMDTFSIQGKSFYQYDKKMSIHSVIRSNRLRLKLTEQQLAERCGVSRPAVQQWEKEGGTAPKRTIQPLVAKTLGITLSQLLETGVSQGTPVWRVESGGIAALASALCALDAAARDRAAVLLQGLARDPEGPWAAWLSELLSNKAHNPAQAGTEPTESRLKQVHAERQAPSHSIYTLGDFDSSQPERKKHVSHPSQRVPKPRNG